MKYEELRSFYTKMWDGNNNFRNKSISMKGEKDMRKLGDIYWWHSLQKMFQELEESSKR